MRSWTFHFSCPPSLQRVFLCEEYHVDADALDLFVRIHQNVNETDYDFQVEFNSQIDEIPQGVGNLRLDNHVWNLDSLDCSNYRSLKSLVIGINCCSKVRSFCLDNCSCLECLSVDSLSFSKSDFPIDGVFRIKDCPLLKKAIIRDMCFQQYSTFSITNAPELVILRVGAFSFIHASTFAMTSCLLSLLFIRFACAVLRCDWRVRFSGLLQCPP